MSGAAKPSLVKTTALAKVQTVFARINALLPSYSTPVSPVAVYQPQPLADVLGNELLAAPTNTSGSPNYTTALWGVWVAPNLNNGADYAVQVECIAAGAGGGGGTTAIGAGGGGGGEYAAEATYLVTPGLPYIWITGIGGPGGTAQPVSGGNQSVQAGGSIPGGDTIFDLAGTGLAGGVHAHGGQPGDLGGTGSGGAGGSGSGNTWHSSGGNGGTTQSGVASDNPQSFQNSATYWTEPTGPSSPPAPPCWLPLDDTSIGSQLNNFQNTNSPASISQFTGGLQAVTNPAAPPQAPTFTTANPIYGPNPTQYGGCVQFKLGKLTSPSARISCTSFGYAGEYLMMSGWVQCDPSGTWGNPTNGYNAIVASNCVFLSGKAGVALYFSYNNGWKLNWYCSNGTTAGTKTMQATASVTPTPGQWYYINAVFNGNAQTMTLNVGLEGGSVTSNSIATTSSLTSVVGGAYPMALGMKPDSNAATYFGYMSNFWFVEGVPSASLINTAFGLTVAAGGSGGGSSGGPYLVNASGFVSNQAYQNGNAGTTATGSSGGAGGTTPAQSAYAAGYTTDGEAGGLGSNSGSTNVGTANLGAGGGGCGTNTSPLAVQTLTAAITTAATFNGMDGSQPGVLYNPNTQGTQGTLLAGGQASDPVSGTKNSILLLPPGLAKTLTGTTIVDCYLTVYNATPSNTVDPLLEISYSADVSIPTTYQSALASGASTPLTAYIMLDGTAAQVISLMNTGFSAALTAPTPATALVLGPGSNIVSATSPAPPYFDAYNAPAGNYFYTSIYGPGALNSAGGSLAPVLTILYTNSAPKQGETGGGGYLAVTVIDQEAIPVAAIQPFATTDSQQNGFAQGYTGPVTAFNPNPVGGGYVAETWHSLAPYMAANWLVDTAAGYAAGFRLTAQGDLELCGRVVASSTTTLIATLPAGYYPTTSLFTSQLLSLSVPVAAVGIAAMSGTTSLKLNLGDTTAPNRLSLGGGTVASTNVISLDGVIIPLSSVPVLY